MGKRNNTGKTSGEISKDKSIAVATNGLDIGIQTPSKPFRKSQGRDTIKEMLLERDPTRDYASTKFSYYGEIFVQDLPPWRLWTGRMMLTSDPIVNFSLNVRNAALATADVKITSPNPRIQLWVQEQWNYLWNKHRPKLLSAKKWGFAPLQMIFKEKDGLVCIDGVKDFAPEDCRALEMQGRLVGQRVKGNPVYFPQGCWLTFGAEFGSPYGTGTLRRSYPAWYEKWMDHGAKRLMQLRMIKDAYIGDIFWYPPNMSVTLPDGRKLSWRDMLREIGENRLSGGAMTLPRLYDNAGKELTGYDPPQDIGGGSQVFEWKDSCDEGILWGADIPLEVTQAGGTGSGYSGRSIPFMTVLSGCSQELVEIVQCVDEQVIRPLAWLNWGGDPDYTIEPVSLLESFTDDISGSAMGGGAMGGPVGVMPAQQMPPGQPQQYSEKAASHVEGIYHADQLPDEDRHHSFHDVVRQHGGKVYALPGGKHLFRIPTGSQTGGSHLHDFHAAASDEGHEHGHHYHMEYDNHSSHHLMKAGYQRDHEVEQEYGAEGSTVWKHRDQGESRIFVDKDDGQWNHDAYRGVPHKWGRANQLRSHLERTHGKLKLEEIKPSSQHAERQQYIEGLYHADQVHDESSHHDFHNLVRAHGGKVYKMHGGKHLFRLPANHGHPHGDFHAAASDNGHENQHHYHMEYDDPNHHQAIKHGYKEALDESDANFRAYYHQGGKRHTLTVDRAMNNWYHQTRNFDGAPPTETFTDKGKGAFLDAAAAGNKLKRHLEKTHGKLKLEEIKPHTSQHAESPLDYVKTRHRGVTLKLDHRPGRVTNVDYIGVAKEHRGKGRAHEVMRDLAETADRHGVTLRLTPDGQYGSSVKRLKKFYAKHGFKPRGLPSGSMERLPASSQFNESGFYPEKARQLLVNSGFSHEPHTKGTLHKHPDLPGHVIVHDRGWQHHSTRRLAHHGDKEFPSVIGNDSIHTLKHYLGSGMGHAADIDKFADSEQGKAYKVRRVRHKDNDDEYEDHQFAEKQRYVEGIYHADQVDDPDQHKDFHSLVHAHGGDVWTHTEHGKHVFRLPADSHKLSDFKAAAEDNGHSPQHHQMEYEHEYPGEHHLLKHGYRAYDHGGDNLDRWGKPKPKEYFQRLGEPSDGKGKHFVLLHDHGGFTHHDPSAGHGGRETYYKQGTSLGRHLRRVHGSMATPEHAGGKFRKVPKSTQHSEHVWNAKRHSRQAIDTLRAAYAHAVKHGAKHHDAAAFAGYHHERNRQASTEHHSVRFSRLRGGHQGLSKSKNYHNYIKAYENAIKAGPHVPKATRANLEGIYHHDRANHDPDSLKDFHSLVKEHGGKMVQSAHSPDKHVFRIKGSGHTLSDFHAAAEDAGHTKDHHFTWRHDSEDEHEVHKHGDNEYQLKKHGYTPQVRPGGDGRTDWTHPDGHTVTTYGRGSHSFRASMNTSTGLHKENVDGWKAGGVRKLLQKTHGTKSLRFEEELPVQFAEAKHVEGIYHADNVDDTEQHKDFHRLVHEHGGEVYTTKSHGKHLFKLPADSHRISDFKAAAEDAGHSPLHHQLQYEHDHENHHTLLKHGYEFGERKPTVYESNYKPPTIPAWINRKTHHTVDNGKRVFSHFGPIEHGNPVTSPEQGYYIKEDGNHKLAKHLQQVHKTKWNKVPRSSQHEEDEPVSQLNFHGLMIGIECKAGHKRKPGYEPLANDYGSIRRTEGKDGDQIDVFIGPFKEESEVVFVFDQPKEDGKTFDEHKVMIGFINQNQAESALRNNYPPGWIVGTCTPMTVEQFKAWIGQGDTSKPVEEQVSAFAEEDYTVKEANWPGAKQTLFKHKNGKEIGEITIHHRPDGHHRVNNVLVWPEFQGKGYAHKLYKHAHDSAKAEGKKLYVSDEHNLTEDGKRIHKSLESKGFLKDGVVQFTEEGGDAPCAPFRVEQFEENEALKRLREFVQRGTSAGIKSALERIRALKKTTLDSNSLAGMIQQEVLSLRPLIQENLAAGMYGAAIEGMAETVAALPAPLQPAATPQATTVPTAAEALGQATSSDLVSFPALDDAIATLARSPAAAGLDYKHTAELVRQGAFAVTGNLTDKAVGEVQKSVTEALSQGTGLEEFVETVTEKLGESVLSDSHLENIYRTNILAAQSDAKQRALSNTIVSDAFPYVSYFSTQDARRRPEHKYMEEHGIDGTNIYRADDPVFKMFRPPWDYQCRCRWYPQTVEQAARAGVKEAKDWMERATSMATQHGGSFYEYLSATAPTVKSFVEAPPFLPPPEFQRPV